MKNRKYEILQQATDMIYSGDSENVIHMLVIEIPMYAKEMAIGFNNWRDGEGWECTLHDDEDIKHWQRYGEGKLVTSDQLYSLYLDSIK